MNIFLALKHALIMEPHQTADKQTLNSPVFFMSMRLQRSELRSKKVSWTRCTLEMGGLEG